jgi:hypothetical protein
LLELEKR